jgi:hypothetical protein
MRWALACALACACRGGPSDDELDRLRAEAIAADREAAKAVPRASSASATLAIGGRGAHATTLDWATLQKLATTSVITVVPVDPGRKDSTKFRGVLVRDLLDLVHAPPDAKQITFVSADAFRATVDVADARAYRQLIALEADGAPIAREKGGPLFLIHPYDELPSESRDAYRDKYPDRFWAFYVTAMVIDTEDVHLRVGARVLDRAALEAMPQQTQDDDHVGWKVEWSSGTVHLRGVALVDLLAAANVALPPHGHVIVRGKAPLHRDPRAPASIAIEDLARCKALLAFAYGDDEAPIPARLGGPLALAMPPCKVPRYDRDPDHFWVTMVEEIEVAP